MYITDPEISAATEEDRDGDTRLPATSNWLTAES